jgi:hypothetical protein
VSRIASWICHVGLFGEKTSLLYSSALPTFLGDKIKERFPMGFVHERLLELSGKSGSITTSGSLKCSGHVSGHDQIADTVGSRVRLRRRSGVVT